MNEKTTNNENHGSVLFDLGPIHVTTMAAQRVSGRAIEEAIYRHIRGDWGRIGEPARIMFRRVFRCGKGTIMSIYHAAGGVEFAIVTDFDAGRTEISLMDEIMAAIPRM